jgi:predicted phosphoribosyltransferase
VMQERARLREEVVKLMTAPPEFFSVEYIYVAFKAHNKALADVLALLRE